LYSSFPKIKTGPSKLPKTIEKITSSSVDVEKSEKEVEKILKKEQKKTEKMLEKFTKMCTKKT